MPPRSQQTNAIRIAIDTGGTFTDCVWLERGRLRVLKTFSTPDDPSRAIGDAVRQIAGDRDVVLLHGTTVGTNAVLERKGARVAFITTAGFEDSIEIGRQARPRLYDFAFEKIPPLVPPELRFGISERTRPDGTVEIAPSAQDLASLTETVKSTAPQAIAISLLFSFANPVNELAAATALRKLQIPLSISHRILPEFREYERASTVVMNAYLQPVLERYLQNLQTKLSSSRIFVMQSSGGIASLSSSAREPVRTVLSGPAGGVIGSAAIGRRLGETRLITFDMGGTSTDVALIDGEPHPTSESEVAGLPVRVPMLNIHTVGAGGGSIARFDAGGALRVGPESAGALPGPICYGRGDQPTVTDANVLLGRLRPNDFLGGEFKLDLARTRDVVQRWLRQQEFTSARRMTPEQFAEGVLRVVNANMERALRVVSVERGFDPRRFALVAFGGAGPLHAAALAEALSIPKVIVPAMPGALSAFGILVSDVVRDYSRTVLLRLKAPARAVPPGLNRIFSELERRAAVELKTEGWNDHPKFSRTVDLRYAGQGYELNVPYSQALFAAFQKEHNRLYGYAYDDRELEIVTLRLRASIPTPATPILPVHSGGGRANVEKIWFGGKWQGAKIWKRDDLPVGRFPGPAIITEYSATTVVPPNWRFAVQRSGDLLLTRS